MRQMYYLADYSCDAYGANAYGQCQTQASVNPTPPGQTTTLADTGTNILVPICLAAAIIVLAITGLVHGLKSKA